MWRAVRPLIFTKISKLLVSALFWMYAASSTKSLNCSMQCEASVQHDPPEWLMGAVLGGLYELPPESLLKTQSGFGRRIRYSQGTKRIKPEWRPVEGFQFQASNACNNVFSSAEVAYVDSRHVVASSSGEASFVGARVPVFSFEVREYLSSTPTGENRNMVELLDDLARREEEAADGIEVSNSGGFHSKQKLFEWDRSKDVSAELKECIRETVALVEGHCPGAETKTNKNMNTNRDRDREYESDKGKSKGANVDHSHDDAWLNVSHQGNWNRLHTHEGYLWSGVLYIAVPDPEDNEDSDDSEGSGVESGEEGEDGDSYWRGEASGALILKPTPHPLETTHDVTATEISRMKEVSTLPIHGANNSASGGANVGPGINNEGGRRGRGRTDREGCSRLQQEAMSIAPSLIPTYGEYVMLKPRKGRMYVFPSWMHHAVMPLQCSQKGRRVSVAWNVGNEEGR